MRESTKSRYGPRPTTDSERSAVARTFRLDVKAAEIIRTLTEADVPVVLLKGHAFASLLYRDGAIRDYVDVDLLVPPTALPACERALRESGFRPHLLRADDQTNPHEHADSWRRAVDGIDVDLHTTLPELTGPAQTTWDVLSQHRRPLELAGTTVEVLDGPASALLAALHRAHHDHNHGTPSEDLVRAATLLPETDWKRAAELADALGGRTPFLAGLEQIEEGRMLRAHLGFERTADEARFEELRGLSREERVYRELRDLDPGGRFRLAVRLVAAHPRKLRMHSALARRGTLGLVAAYALRPVDLGVRMLRTVLDARRRRHRS